MTILENYLVRQFGIAPHFIEELTPLVKEEVLKKGSFLVQEGGYCKKIILIKSGYLRSYFFNGKKEITQWIYWPGQVASDPISFIFEKASKRNFQAITDCPVYSISQENYHKVKEIFPDWYIYERQFVLKILTNLQDRIQSLLSMDAEERFQHFFTYHPNLFNEVPQTYIASMLNMSRETLSRIRAKTIS